MNRSTFRITRGESEARQRLLPSVKALVTVLNQVDQYPALYFNHVVIRDAIRRYEHLWIALLASVKPKKRSSLVPPLDIEWVWFCHMLRPVKYATDSAAMWHAVRPNEPDYIIDHELLPPKKRRSGKLEAEQLWRHMFPDEPFDNTSAISNAPIQQSYPAVTDAAENGSSTESSRISYDIVAAAERQMVFQYEVGIMPQYQQSHFLRSAVHRYRNFLRLQQLRPDEVWVPTYDIDVCWHAHMLHLRWYNTKTVKLRGSVLKHDDSLNDRTTGSELNQRWNATASTWAHTFSSPIHIAGGMWRGNVETAERVLRPTLVEMIASLQSDLVSTAKSWVQSVGY